MRYLFLLSLAWLATQPTAAQTLTIKTIPANAGIYRVKATDSSLILLGTGTAQFRIENKDPNTVVVLLEGYRDVSRSFTKGETIKDKIVSIPLTRRVVKIMALPNDAAITINGEDRGHGTLEVDVDEGQTVTVELKKVGFKPVRRTYRYNPGVELPPVTDNLELIDRLVTVSSWPAGTELFRDDARIGVDTAAAVVSRGGCVTIRAQRAGWLPAERSYCNKDGASLPPVEDRLALTSRMVNVTAPPDARVFVNEKQEGIGFVSLRLTVGSCARVRIEQPGFFAENREYCVRENAAEPPLDATILLKPDESYSTSAQSDQANADVTIQVGAGRTEEQAWRSLAEVVFTHFDMLESEDRLTGYLGTTWQTKSFGDGAVVIRTRLIVRRIGTDPLRYIIKILSERSTSPGATVKDNEKFMPWDRLLSGYKDVIAELRGRLQ